MYIPDTKQLMKRCGIIQDENCQQNNVLCVANADVNEQNNDDVIQEINLTAANIKSLKGLSQIVTTNIKTLWLSENQLKYLAGVQLFINLEELNIDYCQIQSLEPLKQLINLRKLSADSNKIKSVEPLCQLQHLEYLDIGFNQIQSLQGLESLQNLTYLDIDKNLLREVEELGRLKNCKKLEKLCVASPLDGVDNGLIDYKEYVKENLPQVKFLDVDVELQWLSI